MKPKEETLDEWRKRVIRKYSCPNCGVVDELFVLKRSLYKWKDNTTGYLRTLSYQETVEVTCAKCNERLKSPITTEIAKQKEKEPKER